MNLMLQDHPIAWAPPSPFWGDASAADRRAPTILRFATDDFMSELQRLLARDPEKIRGYVAVPETWRGIRKPARVPNPSAGQGGILARLGAGARRASTPATPIPTPSSDAGDMEFKLYQPAHQRFYLVASCLVCQRTGLPDRKLNLAESEKASFVVRRWFPPGKPEDDLPEFDEATWTEHAFVAQRDGSYAWVPVAAAGAKESLRAVVLAAEERLPLFPLSFTEDDGRSRRLLAGLIPVGKRDAYHAAARPQSDGAPGGVTKNTARIALFRKLVSEPWKAIIEQARTARTGANTTPVKPFDDVDEPGPAAIAATIADARGRIQLASWLVLSDLVAFLKTYLPTVYSALEEDSATAPGKANDVLRMLKQTKIGAELAAELTSGNSHTVPASLKDALRQFVLNPDVAAKLDGTIQPYSWPAGSSDYPSFLYPLSDPRFPEQASRPQLQGVTEETNPEVGADPAPPTAPAPLPPPPDFDGCKGDVDHFAAEIIRALETLPDQPEPAAPTAAERPADFRDGWFHLRCVYERPACGALHRDTVSVPSERFKLAAYFDPDAPARPIRIGLPIDTTPAGLRKFDKNTAFIMSDILCGQVARMKALTFGDLVLSVLPWPFHKDLPKPDTGPCEAGLICSLSIPIITLCALIVLIIMVTLLDIVFKWLPFLMVCFPLPGFRAKKKA